MAIEEGDQTQAKAIGNRDGEQASSGAEVMEEINDDGKVSESPEGNKNQVNDKAGVVEAKGMMNTEDVMGSSGDCRKQKADKKEDVMEHQDDVDKEMKMSSTHAVPSIDVNIPQVEKEGDVKEDTQTDNAQSRDDDSDDDSSDDDEGDARSVAMGTTKSVTFSVHHNIDDVDAEIARVTLTNKTSDDQMSNFDVEEDHYGGRAATTNTPVTDVLIGYEDDEKRRTQTPSGDLYEHAISVMRHRSSMTHYTQSQATIKSNLNSAHPRSPPPSGPARQAAVVAKAADGLPIYNLPTVVSRIEHPPFVDCANCSFYVTQKRAQPVPPVKVWKGYHSNLYFEPFVCRKSELTSPNAKPNKYPHNLMSPTSAPKTLESGIELPKLYPPPSMSQKSRSQTASTKSVRIATSAISARTATKSRASTSSAMPKSRPLTTATTTRQLAVLDKLSVLSTFDANLGEDIRWIDGMESTGTLQVGEPLRPTGTTTHEYRRSAGPGRRHYKMRICRGLVSHSLAGQYNSQLPNGVSGGRMLDSPSKLEYLEQEYQGESHFLSDPRGVGMFSSPIPTYSIKSSSPLPSLHHRQLSASTVQCPIKSPTDRKTSVASRK